MYVILLLWPLESSSQTWYIGVVDSPKLLGEALLFGYIFNSNSHYSADCFAKSATRGIMSGFVKTRTLLLAICL